MFRFVALELLPVLPEILERGGSLMIEEHLQWKVRLFQDLPMKISGCRLELAPWMAKVVYGMRLVKEPDGTLAALSLHLIK